MSGIPPRESSPSSRSGAVIGGLFLIGLGLVFLMQNFGYFYFGNWWALFILFGTVGAWSQAWTIYQNNGQRITQAVTGPFIGGLFPLAAALIFLLNLNWGDMWPIFLIIAGLFVLSRSWMSPR